MTAPARFFDTRAAYSMFVTATDEKSVVADQIGLELPKLTVRHPGLRVFDAGMGDGSLLAQLMRHMHQAFPFIPWLVVAKEISIEDVRQALARLPDRFLEHPEMVFVVTNHHFRDAPSLPSPEGTVWREVALDGATTNDFTEQIEGLYGQLAQDWQVRTSPITGNPLYVNPAVLVLYRADRRFLLEPLIPEAGGGGQTRVRPDDRVAGVPGPHSDRSQGSKRPGSAGTGPGTWRPAGWRACSRRRSRSRDHPIGVAR